MEKGKDFLFSIIMGIYNIEEYLEEAILSIIEQSLNFNKHVQLILVDDGSTDNSSQICRKYEEIHPNNIIYTKKMVELVLLEIWD